MQVNIKGKPFKVILEKDTFLKEGVACAGFIDYRDQKIHIATNDEDGTPRIVYHELLHGFFKGCGLDEYAHNELLVDWFANNIQEINNCALQIMRYIRAIPKTKTDKKRVKGGA